MIVTVFFLVFVVAVDVLDEGVLVVVVWDADAAAELELLDDEDDAADTTNCLLRTMCTFPSEVCA